MGVRDEFADILQADEPLAPFTILRLGGPAQFLARPRSAQELAALAGRAAADGLPLRLLGGGGQVLVPDEGVKGVVVRLSEPAFQAVTVEGRAVRAGGGASLSAVISQAARHELAGLETLVGMRGTVGGAVRVNIGDRTGQIGQFVRRVEVLDESGELATASREEVRALQQFNPAGLPVILSVEFELDADAGDAIVKRMRKAWITRKGNQPFTFEPAARLFKDPRGLAAADLIEKAGVARVDVGGVELSDRNPNYAVAKPGATARDVLRLMDLVASRVREATGVALERDLIVW